VPRSPRPSQRVPLAKERAARHLAVVFRRWSPAVVSPDRQAVLRYRLATGPKAASKRFEVYAESEPVTLADGQAGGRAFALA
jgi:hypothetical protein